MLSSPSILVVAALLVVQVSCQFNRTCENNQDCYFMRLHMVCDQGACTCAIPAILGEFKKYTFVSFRGTCIMADKGPCGSYQGLNVLCPDGEECIQNRCRDPEAVKTAQDGDFCMLDYDCYGTLRCAAVLVFSSRTFACKPSHFKDEYKPTADEYA